MRSRSKLTLLIGVVALVASACAVPTASGSPGRPPDAPDTTVVGTSPDGAQVGESDSSATGLPSSASALDDRFHDSFPDSLIDPRSIVSGGPPPDGIPPIDNPEFVSVRDADDWLNDPEPVLVVDVDGDVRAYPIQIMMWHEIVNDTVGGLPLSVTYCPLCNSAISFIRTIRGVETTFGTSGSLYFANLVMYDRATESLWNQLDGRAVVGTLAGEVLEQYPSTTMAWADFKQTRPDAIVLDRNRTGASRNYGTNPYTGLDDPNGQPFLFNGEIDVRAKAMQRIVALEDGVNASAWTLDAISDDSGRAVTEGEFSDEPIVIFWKAGETSALDTADIAEGRDVGTVGVFSPLVGTERLTFETDGGGFVDDQTGSAWNVLGKATSGELSGTQLEPKVFVRTFWFSWAAFRPETQLVEST